MTAFVRTELFDTNTTLEAHLVHLIRAYSATVGNARYAERSEVDSQPFCFQQVGFVNQGLADTRRFLIARLAIPLDELGDVSANPIWAQTVEFPNAIVLPAGLKATS